MNNQEQSVTQIWRKCSRQKNHESKYNHYGINCVLL